MTNMKIRTATLEDLNRVTEIEATCFPSSEAADKTTMKERLEVYQKGFFVGEIDGEIIGFINGGAFNADSIQDEFFESMEHHNDHNKALVIFGLDVHPNYQGKGIASLLMKHFIEFARSECKEAVLLTCKDHLLHYYEKFGYINNGPSNSSHGGAKWYDMTLKLI